MLMKREEVLWDTDLNLLKNEADPLDNCNSMEVTRLIFSLTQPVKLLEQTLVGAFILTVINWSREFPQSSQCKLKHLSKVIDIQGAGVKQLPIKEENENHTS